MKDHALGFNKNSACLTFILVTIFAITRLIYEIYERWWALYLSAVLTLPAFGGVLALHFVSVSLPDWRWILPLAFMYVIAAVLPFINENFSGFLYRESFAPKTWLGKKILYLALAIGPAAGAFGAMLSQSFRRISDGLIGYSVLGLLLHLGYVWATVSAAHQAWELRPWKKTGREQ